MFFEAKCYSDGVVTVNKVGRNDPCPCGSGKKYKKCCLEKESAVRAQVNDRRRLEEGLTQKLMDFVDKKMTRSELEKVLKEVSAHAVEDLDVSEEIATLEAYDHIIHTHSLSKSGLTILETFAKEMSSTLTTDELSVFKEWLTHRHGLWEVREVSQGEWLTAKDVYSDMVIRSVGENTSRSLSTYDLFMGRIETLSGNGAFTGTGFLVPRMWREEVIKAIRNASVSAGYKSPSDFVHACPLQSRKIASDAMKLEANTVFLDWDGYPTMNCHAVYGINDRKKLVSWLDSRADFEKTGEDGQKTNYELLQCGPSAGKPCENPNPVKERSMRFGSERVDMSGKEKVRTIASLDIKGGRLEVFAISAERLAYCRSLLEDGSADAIEFKSEEIKAFDRKKRGDGEGRKNRKEKDDIPPHIKAKLEAEYFSEYYRGWVSAALPALDGATPKAALRDKRLRPVLIELLKDFINMDDANGVNHTHTIFSELGIKPEDLGLKL